MEVSELLLRTAAAFEEHKLPFALIGGFAVSSWIEPRATKDVDIFAGASKRETASFKAALVAAGARATALEMRWLFERKFVRLKTSRERGQPILDVYVVRSPHERATLQRSVLQTIAGRGIRTATPEDLILLKLQAWRGIDRTDIENLIRGIRNLDTVYIESWLDPIARATAVPMRTRWMVSRSR